MDKQKTIEMIREFSNARGVSGFEDEMLVSIRRHAQGLGKISEDGMRNLYLKRSGGKGPVLLLDAHSDEVGFLIKAVRPNGIMDFMPLGSWVSYNLPAHRVLVKNRDGQWVPGIIASKPPHFVSEAERNRPPELEAMGIDVGASSAAEIEKEYRIGIAAPVVPDTSFECRGDLMIGKAFDNRLGCATLIAALLELKDENLKVDITGGFAAQEEVGLRGAKITAQKVRPDIAISFEGCPADDTIVEPYAVQAALKKGPMLRHIDPTMITNPRFQRFVLEKAKENDIPVQESVRATGGTNSGAIHLSGKAVPSVVISIPVRYIHSHYCFASYADFENSVKLACAAIRALTPEIIEGF